MPGGGELMGMHENCVMEAMDGSRTGLMVIQERFKESIEEL